MMIKNRMRLLQTNKSKYGDYDLCVEMEREKIHLFIDPNSDLLRNTQRVFALEREVVCPPSNVRYVWKNVQH